MVVEQAIPEWLHVWSDQSDRSACNPLFCGNRGLRFKRKKTKTHPPPMFCKFIPVIVFGSLKWMNTFATSLPIWLV